MLESQSESESWWVSCVVITCDGESTAVWNDDLAFLDTACHDVAACTEAPCKEGPAYDEPLARNTGAAPLVTTTDFLVCFRTKNMFFSVSGKNGNANDATLMFTLNLRAAGTSVASLAGGGWRRRGRRSRTWAMKSEDGNEGVLMRLKEEMAPKTACTHRQF